MAMVPHERSLVTRLKDKPFALLGVDCDLDSDRGRGAVAARGINWRSWFNGTAQGGSISRRWGVEGLPTLFLIDRKGTIRAVFRGAVDEEELEQRIEDLLKEKN